MISCLKGELFHKSLEKVTILVNGVGYEVFLSTASLEKLPHLGEEVFLYTYTYVREDILTLFGFVDQDEKQFVFEHYQSRLVSAARFSLTYLPCLRVRL